MDIPNARTSIAFVADGYSISAQNWKTGLGQLISLVQHGADDWEIKFGDKLALMLPIRGMALLETSNLNGWPTALMPMKTRSGVPANAGWLTDAPHGLSFQDTDTDAIKTLVPQRSMIISDLRSFTLDNGLKKLVIELDSKAVHLWKTPTGISFTLSGYR